MDGSAGARGRHGCSESPPIPGKFWPDLSGVVALVGCREAQILGAACPRGVCFWLSGLRRSKGTVKVNPGSGGGGRRKLSSVHGWLDDFGLEFLVSKSNKDSLRALMRGVLVAGSPRPPPAALPHTSPPICLGVSWEPSCARGHTAACGVWVWGILWTVSVFLFCFPSLALVQSSEWL